MGTRRICPNCSERTVPVQRLLLANYWCSTCGSLVRAHRFYGGLFYLLTAVVTLISTIAVASQMGFYAALLMLPLPLGSMGYLRARFCPLEAEANQDGHL